MSTEIRNWLNAIGALTAGNMPVAEAQAKLAAYTPLLIQRFPPQAFTPASLEAVAAKCKFFPSYAEICDHLGAWWKENRPVEQRFPQIAAPTQEPRQGPTPEEIAYVEARVAEAKAICAANRRPETLRPVKPSYLTPEQLRAHHKQAGTIVPPWLEDRA